MSLIDRASTENIKISMPGINFYDFKKFFDVDARTFKNLQKPTGITDQDTRNIQLTVTWIRDPGSGVLVQVVDLIDERVRVVPDNASPCG